MSKLEFQPRNSYHLLLSPTHILPLLLLLDPQHVSWMSEGIFESALDALKSRVGIKLRREKKDAGGSGAGSGAGKPRIDVYRGVGYQMAYFFRRLGRRHTVLLKTRKLKFKEDPERPKNNQPIDVDSDDETTPRKKRRVDPGDNPGIDSNIALEGGGSELSEDALEGESGENREADAIRVKDEDDVNLFMPPPPLPREAQGKGVVRPPPMNEIDVKSETIDEKPELQVSYQKFGIYGKMLVVVIEPWPPLQTNVDRSETGSVPADLRQLSATPIPLNSRRSSSMAPFAGGPSNLNARPLFLPEDTPLPEGKTSGNRREQDVEDEDEFPDVGEIFRREKERSKDRTVVANKGDLPEGK